MSQDFQDAEDQAYYDARNYSEPYHVPSHSLLALCEKDNPDEWLEYGVRLAEGLGKWGGFDGFYGPRLTPKFLEWFAPALHREENPISKDLRLFIVANCLTDATVLETYHQLFGDKLIHEAFKGIVVLRYKEIMIINRLYPNILASQDRWSLEVRKPKAIELLISLGLGDKISNEGLHISDPDLLAKYGQHTKLAEQAQILCGSNYLVRGISHHFYAHCLAMPEVTTVSFITFVTLIESFRESKTEPDALLASFIRHLPDGKRSVETMHEILAKIREPFRQQAASLIGL